ncbi:MAG: hypothetical protein Ct9H90mP13_13150 [Pseudomonadota bacterium]|nr:MAG: hypothetical protein Ct9H90mP13_13150 [Pseudomonadota bacterium]
MGTTFQKKKEARLWVYSILVSRGSGIAFIIGGQIIAYVASRDNLILPIIGEIYPWQALFIMVGLPGLIVAALMMTVKEPERREKIEIKTMLVMQQMRSQSKKRSISSLKEKAPMVGFFYQWLARF